MDPNTLAKLAPDVALTLVIYMIIRLLLSKFANRMNGNGNGAVPRLGDMPVEQWRLEHAAGLRKALEPLEKKTEEQTAVLREIRDSFHKVIR